MQGIESRAVRQFCRLFDVPDSEIGDDMTWGGLGPSGTATTLGEGCSDSVPSRGKNVTWTLEKTGCGFDGLTLKARCGPVGTAYSPERGDFAGLVWAR